MVPVRDHCVLGVRRWVGRRERGDRVAGVVECDGDAGCVAFGSRAARHRRHGRAPGRRLHDGFRRSRGVARGAAGASREARPVLDRRDGSHQRAVPRVRRGDRLRHHRRTQARLGGDPEAGAARHAEAARRSARRGQSRLHAAERDRHRARNRPVVDVDARRELAASAGARQFDRGQGRPARRACVVGRRRRVRTLVGQALADRSGVGVRGAGRVVGRRVRLGTAALQRDGAAVQLVAGGLPDEEPRRRSLRAECAGQEFPGERGTASTTWPATCGSGAATGTAPTPT